jgi:hypothetical protein
MLAARTPWWTWTWPVLAWVVLSLTFFLDGGGPIVVAAGVTLLATGFAAVYHA